MDEKDWAKQLAIFAKRTVTKKAELQRVRDSYDQREWKMNAIGEWMDDSDTSYDDIEDDDGVWGDDSYLEEFEEMAVTLMDEFVANNLDSHVLLKYPNIAEWWGKVIKERKIKEERRRKAEEKRAKEEEDKRKRAELISRLTADELRLLGITK